MKATDYAYCGMECSKCPLYIATMNNDIEELKHILFLGPTIECTIEKHGCKGCRSDLNHQMCQTCFMRNCAINTKHVDSCSHCDEFPCNYLNCYISPETKERLIELNKNK